MSNDPPHAETSFGPTRPILRLIQHQFEQTLLALAPDPGVAAIFSGVRNALKSIRICCTPRPVRLMFLRTHRPHRAETRPTLPTHLPLPPLYPFRQ